METATRSCSYCLSPLRGVSCPHCDTPHVPDGCTLCALAVLELERVLRGMRQT